jgi:hypothetical protein
MGGAGALNQYSGHVGHQRGGSQHFVPGVTAFIVYNHTDDPSAPSCFTVIDLNMHFKADICRHRGGIRGAHSGAERCRKWCHSACIRNVTPCTRLHPSQGRTDKTP